MKQQRRERKLEPYNLHSKHRRSPREELDGFYRNRPVGWDEAKDGAFWGYVEGVVPGCDPFAQKNLAAEPVMLWSAGNL